MTMKEICFNCGVCCTKRLDVLENEKHLFNKTRPLVSYGYSRKKHLGSISYLVVKPKVGNYCEHYDIDSGLCSIYENRPWVCKKFPFGTYQGTLRIQEEKCPKWEEFDDPYLRPFYMKGVNQFYTELTNSIEKVIEKYPNVKFYEYRFGTRKWKIWKIWKNNFQ